MSREDGGSYVAPDRKARIAAHRIPRKRDKMFQTWRLILLFWDHNRRLFYAGAFVICALAMLFAVAIHVAILIIR